MHLLKWLPYLLFTSVVAASADGVTELKIETNHLPLECSEKAASGDAIEVHYTGTLYDTGNKFDSSIDRNTPFPLTLGVGHVIKGWDEGLIGMCVGEKRTLTIPPDMAYGARGFGKIIPPHSTLVFETELVSLKKRGKDEL